MSRIPRALPALIVLVLFLLPPAATAEPDEGFVFPRATYHTYASMVAELQALQANHPDMVRMESIGKTYEGRDIWAVKLSDDVTTNDTAEPDILIDGGIHAREIMGVEVPLYVLNYLINNYGINETCTKYVNTREIWFVPMDNPDGHVYVEGNNDWRKNRRPTGGGNIGVDLNRNFGYMFGTDGATSPNPWDETYHGPYPFSENETIALRDLGLRQRFATQLSFHSYSELVLYPWGYTTTNCPDNAEFVTMANAMAAFNGYTPMQASDLYVAHGGSEDWFYANTSARSFVIEVDQQFYPPESQIDSTCNLNREPALYLVGYPTASIIDGGIWAITAPLNGTLVDPDKVLNVTAKVMNYGTSETDIPVDMEITSVEGYLYTNSTSVHLRAGQVSDAKIAWTPPMPGYENYTVKVRSNLSGDNYAWNNEKCASFRMKTKYGAALNVTNTTRNVFPSQSVNYSLHVTSLSNRGDDILLVKTGTHLDWAQLPASIHLAPAAQGDLEMMVSVPRDATPGDSAVVSIRASSSTGQGSSGLVTTTTYVLNPAPSAEAGDDIIANVTVAVSLDGTRSTTPAGAITKYSWDFGDGNKSEGAKVTHAYEKRGKYLVNLTVSNDLGWTSSDTLNVTVLQFFKVGLSVDRTSVLAYPGQRESVNLTLLNEGNGRDTIALTLVTPGWNASLDSQTWPMAPGGTMTYMFSFTPPGDELFNSSFRFLVNASSVEYPYARKELSFTATVGAVHDLNLSVPGKGLQADPGGAATLYATWSNRGNIDEKPTLASSDVPEGWTVSFSPDKFTLGPGNTTKVKVTATVPAGALFDWYHFKVNDQKVDVTVNARYALDASVATPVLSIKQGESGAFTLNITNRANARDSFTVLVTGLPEGVTSDQYMPASLLAPGANGTLTIALKVAKGAPPGRYNLNILVASGNSTNSSKTLPVQVEVVKVTTGGVFGDSSNFFTSPLFIIIMIIIIAAAVGGGVYAATRKKRPPQAPPDAQRLDEAPQPPSQPTSYEALYGKPPAAPMAAPVAAGAGPAPPEAVPLPPGAAGGNVPVAEAAPAEPIAAASTPELSAAAAAATATVGPAPAAPAEVLCLWCFKPFKQGEAPRACGSCGAQLHEECAKAAGKCSKCGNAL